jgi:MFS family permease
MSPRTTFAALLTLGAFDAAGYGVIAPVVPTIAEQTGSGPAVMGALVTTFAVGQLVGYPIAGRIVQRRHATVVIWVALALTVVGDLGFILGEGLAVYFPARLLMGLGAAGLWLGLTFATLERFPGEEYRRLTALMAAYAVGGIAGPALGSIGGIRGPFVAHLALVLCACLVVAALGAPREPMHFGSDRAALRSTGFWLSCASIALVAITIGVLEGPLPLHFAEELDQSQIAALYVGTSIFIGVSAARASRWPARPNVVLGTAAIVAGIAVIGLSTSPSVWIAAAAVAGTGFGVCQSGSMGVLLEAVGPARIVLAMVVWSQLFAIGYIVGPAVGGLVAEGLGFGAIGLVPLIAAIPVAVLLFGRRPRRRSATVPSGH